MCFFMLIIGFRPDIAIYFLKREEFFCMCLHLLISVDLKDATLLHFILVDILTSPSG